MITSFFALLTTAHLLFFHRIQNDTHIKEQGSGVRANRRGQSAQCVCGASSSEEQQRKPNAAVRTSFGRAQTQSAPGASK